jgi:hypothetical protein
MDGFGGVVARGLARAGGGVSYLANGRSFLLQAFAQESLQAPGANSDGKAFTEGGASARFDWTWGLALSLEAHGGARAVSNDPLLGRRIWASRYGVAGSFRRIFPNGMWFGLSSSIDRDAEHITFEATHSHYDVQTPADFAFTAAFGIPLWRSR